MDQSNISNKMKNDVAGTPPQENKELTVEEVIWNHLRRKIYKITSTKEWFNTMGGFFIGAALISILNLVQIWYYSTDEWYFGATNDMLFYSILIIIFSVAGVWLLQKANYNAKLRKTTKQEIIELIGLIEARLTHVDNQDTRNKLLDVIFKVEGSPPSKQP
jgi:hypothetical protein